MDGSVTFDVFVEIHGLGLESVELGNLQICFLSWIKLSDGAQHLALATGQILQNPSNTHKGTTL